MGPVALVVVAEIVGTTPAEGWVKLPDVLEFQRA
jgi:hypothetical protein